LDISTTAMKSIGSSPMFSPAAQLMREIQIHPSFPENRRD
jgi:hypothetical protein